MRLKEDGSMSHDCAIARMNNTTYKTLVEQRIKSCEPDHSLIVVLVVVVGVEVAVDVSWVGATLSGWILCRVLLLGHGHEKFSFPCSLSTTPSLVMTFAMSTTHTSIRLTSVYWRADKIAFTFCHHRALTCNQKSQKAHFRDLDSEEFSRCDPPDRCLFSTKNP